MGSDETALRLDQEPGGYHSALVTNAGPGVRYRYRIDGGNPMPDPASRFQPEGVHGPSEVVDPRSFSWRHDPPAEPPSEGSAIYELHIGTFSPEGTFAGAAERLPHLADLGVDTIEIMPLADFPGRWNWGYDPGSFFAPTRAYGRPDDLRRLIDAAHELGLRVLLDVVYNHFGPDGAYLPAFSPHVFTSRHSTPWGEAVDFDGPQAEGVRRYCLENALMWLDEYRFDGLRLDATFAIIDESPNHLLAELVSLVSRLAAPRRFLVAEDPRNLRNMVLPGNQGGFGLDAVWADDFHHMVRVRLSGEKRGYYGDFSGSSADLARTVTGNWFYRGHHSAAHGGPRGTQASDLAAHRFVYCIQNHDQVGNRPDGSRLNHDVSPAAYRAASALLLFLPQLPMLFMGQEWAAATPFLYFTDHQGELGKRVSAGRKREFADFSFGDEVPDPQDEETFRRSRLDWSEREREPHAGTLRLYRDLLDARRGLHGPVEVTEVNERGLVLRRSDHLLLVAFAAGATLTLPAGARMILSSERSDYVGEPLPPSVGNGDVRFRREGALIVEVPA